MLIIKTEVKKSPIEGRGLFSIEEISKGQPVWKQSLQDIHLTPDEYWELVELNLSDYIDKYATIESHGHRHYDHDNCRYMNHSDSPNIIFTAHCGYALRDIREGEELTCDYSKITTAEHFKQLIS